MEGSLLDGRFRIENQLGSQAVFDSYAAMDLKTRISVVVKILKGDWAGSGELLPRLKIAAGRCREIQMPTLLHMVAAEALLTEALVPYIVRGRSDWPSFASAARAAPSCDAICKAGLALALSLQRLHQAGVCGGVHPDNLFLAADGKFAASDLGLSHGSLLPVAHDHPHAPFVTPETLAASRACQPGDDIYGWGAAMYLLLMGRPPERPCDRELTRALEQRYQGFGIDVVMRAFHQDPAMRFRDGRQLADAVKADFRLVPVQAAAPAPAAPRPAASAVAAAPPPAPPPALPPTPPAPSAAAKTAPRPADKPKPVAPAPPRAKAPPPAPSLRSEIVRRHALLPGQTFYEVLDVKEDCSDDDIKHAFHARAKKFHPDRLVAEPMSDADRALGQQLFEAITEAYDTLTDDTRRKLYDIDLRYRESAARRGVEQAIVHDEPRDRKLVAEEYFRDAKALLTHGNFWGAAQTIRQALLIDPLRPDFHLELGRTLSRDKRWHREAERAFKRVLELTPGDAEVHYQLALLYRDNGMALRAQEYLRKALDLDPGNARYRELPQA